MNEFFGSLTIATFHERPEKIGLSLRRFALRSEYRFKEVFSEQPVSIRFLFLIQLQLRKRHASDNHNEMKIVTESMRSHPLSD